MEPFKRRYHCPSLLKDKGEERFQTQRAARRRPTPPALHREGAGVRINEDAWP